jgi:excinuclease ABC subunit A
MPQETPAEHDPFVRVFGSRVHNLRGVDVAAPRDALVAFTGISGSGKSSLAFGTIYAEAQRRYFESVAPYARRLLLPTGAPKVDDITGLPPAVALQQRRGATSSRSSVGTVTTLSNLLRMLFSRAGTFPRGFTERLDSDAFSPNTAVGACPECHGLGRIHQVTEDTLVPDPSLTIREGAVAAWPGAWQGQNLRDILITLGYDIDKPWRKLPKRQRNWILFTDEQPTVEIHPHRHDVIAEYTYNGTFSSAERHVRHTLANSQSAMMRRRVLKFVDSVDCPVCDGSGLRPEALAVTFAGQNIAALVALPLIELADALRPAATRTEFEAAYESTESGELTEVATMIAADLVARIEVLIDLGLGYLTLSRRTPTVSPGELQRLRLATQLRAGLFGVLYVLDEPSAGLHPADAEPLLDVLDRLRRAGNSLFVVEHDMDVVRRADWIVDVGPGAGELGGEVLYSGPVAGLADVAGSVTRDYLFGDQAPAARAPRHPSGNLALRGIRFHNLRDLDVDIPLGVYTAVTGVSGSGKSTLVYKVLGDVVTRQLGGGTIEETDGDEGDAEIVDLDHDASIGVTADGVEQIKRLVAVDQRPIGRTPRSTLATYTGLFDAVRKAFAATPMARRRGWTAGRFSFNVADGRCPTCQGEGFVSVETAVPAGHVRQLPDVPRRPLQPGHPRGALPRPHDRRRARDDRRRGVGILRRRSGRGAESCHTAGSRAGVSAPGPARDGAFRWGGAADQVGLGAAAAAPRTHPLRPRRADHRSASCRRRSAGSSAAPAGRRGQHRRGGRARHAVGGRHRLGHRPRARSGRCRRSRGGGGNSGRGGRGR